MQAMEISRTALEVEWRRLEVIAENLANASTIQTANGTPYQPRHLISGPKGDFAAYLDQASAHADGQQDKGLEGVRVYAIESQPMPPHIVHEPGNPQADENGNVAYPGIDHAAEMTLMIKTSRAYEANIVAMNLARQMYSKALELGQRQ
jgi:flagellar basal-body rod protein FlgC